MNRILHKLILKYPEMFDIHVSSSCLYVSIKAGDLLISIFCNQWEDIVYYTDSHSSSPRRATRDEIYLFERLTNTI